MKKTFLLAMLLSVLFAYTGCSDDDPIVEIVESLEATPESIEFKANGNEQATITVKAEGVTWIAKVETGEDWLTIETGVGIETGIGLILITAADNLSPEAREGKIVISPSSDKVQDVTIAVSQAAHNFDIVFTKAHLNYWGDFYDADLGQYDMILGSGDAGFDDDGYVTVQNGKFILLENLCQMPEDYFDERTIHLTPGRYNIVEYISGGKKESMTSFAGNYEPDWDWYDPAYIIEYKDGSLVSQTVVNEGYFDVAVDGEGNYTVYFDLGLDDGSKVTAYYQGTPNLFNNAEPPYYSTLTGDVTASGLTQGTIEFYADKYGLSINAWKAYMWSDGITRNEEGVFSGTGEIFQIEFYSSLSGSTTQLPDANYILSEIGQAGNALYGYTSIFTGTYNGSWYFKLENGTEVARGPMCTGTIAASCTEGKYSIKVVEAIDDNNHKISGTYDGELVYTDKSTVVPPPPPPPLAPAKSPSRR